ncbi:hypothetical protein V2S66_19530 [Streptomyces sp. V4-01]|uniref:DNA-directed RNA polymerase specialized sigma24 family protein n=1 Tax=Actinacidiphila polyblastidii TaxID=3110430 RepID=A0ABU7PED2_9ACTN|nr:hypothetical protein [Streptomyces sp. V4-01]
MNTRAQSATSATAPPAGRKAAPVAVEEAEAALVEHYPRLVALAYLTLPTGLGKHRRVLTAHRLVQRSLPRSERRARGGAYGLLRGEVLREALAFGGGGRVRVTARKALEVLRPPAVLGLRVHPRAGGGDELALERALSVLPAAGRAAFALRTLDGLGERGAHTVLAAAGVADPAEALRAAAALGLATRAATGTPAAGGLTAESAFGAGEFDPCTVQTRPTDLLRRRQRSRVALVAAAVVGVGALVLALGGAGAASRPYAAPGSPAGDPSAADPAALVRVPAQTWRGTARMDFSAWPARGDRASDGGLLRRALAVWAHPGAAVDVSATPGTPRSGPAQPPQLLFAGDADDAAVVLFYDGLRVVRYAEPRRGGGRAALDFAQAENADLTTSAAVLVDRVDGNARFLTAPWVAAAQTRDLLRPDRPGSALHRSADGVTDPVRTPDAVAGGTCGSSWPVLQLRSSATIAEHHSFLLSDLGDILPTHLTYTAPPHTAAGASSRPGPPREATGGPALESWAHDACGLTVLRGQSVRAVDDWEFARTPLPQGAGTASWTCERADTWRGPGLATVRFVPPDAAAAAPGSVVGQQSDGSACSRFGQNVMAGVMWKSPSAEWYLLAAGSRNVTRISATHGIDAHADGPYLAVRAPRGTRATLRGELGSGGTLSPLDGR